MVLFFLFYGSGFAQDSGDIYRVQFTDKDHSSFSIDHPEEYLSHRALERRLKQNISISENDLPVSLFYVDSLKRCGLSIVNCSRWFNTVTIRTDDTALINSLSGISFIRSVVRTRSYQTISHIRNKWTDDNSMQRSVRPVSAGDGDILPQIALHKGQTLHNQGYQGQRMIIAVIDAGFTNITSLNAFSNLYENHQILGSKDFVDGDSDVLCHWHGTAVLSVMACNLPGQISGTAPEASYWLLRSEDGNAEYLAEEDNWVAAAEFADSAGADIINTSLGYYQFDDSSQNHSYEDMDGNTTIIAIAADIAFSKGMIVVVSAGNEGNKLWHFITTPADADSVLSAGSVNSEGSYSGFSSKGPSSDRRVKPDVAAMGELTTIVNEKDQIVQASGTSFAAPLISGLTACLWQANPQKSNWQIMDAIKKSADHYLSPDTLTGYGIPDFAKANLILHGLDDLDMNKESLLQVYPNPFQDHVVIHFYSSETQVIEIELCDISNKTILNKGMAVFIYSLNSIMLDQISSFASGIYILKLKTRNNVFTEKLIKGRF